MTTENKNIRVFSNNTEFGFYIERNCYNCLKCLDNTLGKAEELFHKGECKIYEHNLLASIGSGEIPLEIAQRMGYDNEVLSPKCKEFVSDAFEYEIIAGDLFANHKINTGVFDVKGREIKVGDDIIYVAQKEILVYTVIVEDGKVGFTVKHKDTNYNFYRSIYLFVPEVDNYKTFEIINEN
jgi:hypothetical protein